MNNLVMIEYKEQINSLESYINENSIVVALNPCAQSGLINKGIPFLKSDEYFGNESHINVLKKSDEIITLMRKSFYLSDSVGVSHAYERQFFYFFRNYYLHYWLSHLQIIHKAVQSIKPETIILPQRINPDQVSSVIGGSSSLVGYIGSLYAEKHGYKFKIVGAHVEIPKIQSSSNFIKWCNKIFFKVQLFFYRLISRNKNVVMATHTAYNLPKVLEYVSQKVNKSLVVGGLHQSILKYLLLVIKGLQWKFVKFPPDASKKTFNKFIYDYHLLMKKYDKVINENANIFSFHEINLHRPIMDYLRNGLSTEMYKTFHGSHAYFKILKARKPVFAVTNQASGFHYAFGELCGRHKTNAMLISHGSHTPHEAKWAKLEWDEHARFMINSHYPLVAVQTPWAEKFLKNQDGLFSKPVLTGPLLYAQNNRDNHEKKMLIEKLFPENWKKKILLHAATPFGWNYFHPWVNLTHDEYILHINELIQAVEKIDEIYLAVRIRLKSFYGMSLEEVKRLFISSECYGIYTEGSFEEYLIASDLLVSFSSTTIEEALQNKIPVLQYDPFNRYCHIPAQKLEKNGDSEISPIYYATSFSDLSWGIKWITNNHLNKKEKDYLDWSDHILEPKIDWFDRIINR